MVQRKSRYMVGWAIASLCLMSGGRAIAQVTADTTQSTRSQVDSTDALNVVVEGGTRRPNSNHLFHSFETFSVPTGGQVTFIPNGASDIFSRVTGGQLSRIQGTIEVDGNANLFLLNPNGIIFGPEARLDMTGSFAASSANRLIFERGENNRFVFGSRNQIDQSDLLRLTTDIGLQYGSQRNGPITVNRSNLVVMAGESLSLLGGRVRVNGDRLARSDGNNTSQLRAPQGQLTLIGMRRGQLESEDIFRIAPDRTGGELLDPGNQFANVDIRQQAGLFAGNPKGEGDGNAGIIDIRGNNVTVDGSDINTRNTQRGNVGLITMQAARNLQLQNDTLISNQATDRVVNLETTRGVWIIAPNGSVEMSESRVETDLAGGGSASRIRIEARDQIRLDRTTLTTTATGVARGGGIRLRTNDILIARGSRLIASNESEIEQASEQQVDSDSQTMGLAGRIVLEGNSQDDSELERVVIRNSRLLTKVNEQAESNRIQINAPHARIRISGSTLISRSSGTGNAGDIQIEANQVGLTESQLISRTTGDGQAGTITINAPQEFTLADGSRLRSSTAGRGNAGEIQINAGNVTISGWRILDQSGISRNL